MTPSPAIRSSATFRRIATGIILAGGLASIRYTWRALSTSDPSMRLTMRLVGSVHLLWLCAAPIILVASRRALMPGALRRDRIRLAIVVVLTLVAEPLWTVLVNHAFGYASAFAAATMARTDLNVLVVAFLIGLELTEMRIEAARTQLARHAQLLRAVAEAQLAALTLHLQPHFLFNTLQLVAETARSDALQAAGVVRALRRLFAESAKHTTRRIVSVTDEVDFLKTYLSIQRTRFEDRLRVEIDVDPGVYNAELPHMLLQPLVENAIQHGIGRVAHGGTVHVSIQTGADRTRLLALVRDDGPGLLEGSERSARPGRGIANTRARLSALYGNDFIFQLRPASSGGTEAYLDIPLHELRQGAPAEVAVASSPTPPRLIGSWGYERLLAWVVLCILPPLVLMVLYRVSYGMDAAMFRTVVRGQMRDWPILILAFLAAGWVERLRRPDQPRHWILACHLVVASLVAYSRVLVAPLFDILIGPMPAQAMTVSLFALRPVLIYTAGASMAHAQEVMHWAAARSRTVQDGLAALAAAERAVARAQVHQPAVLAGLSALEESCRESAESADRHAQALAQMLRLCLDALDNPSHDLGNDIDILNAHCVVFGIGHAESDVHADSLRVLVPPGTLASALAVLNERPTVRVRVRGDIVSGCLDLVVVVEAIDDASHEEPLRQALTAAMTGEVTIRESRAHGERTLEVTLPAVYAAEVESDPRAPDVLLTQMA